MPTWLTIVLALGGSALISTIVGLFITRVFNKTFNKRDAAAAEAKRCEQELNEIKAAQEREDRKKDVLDSVNTLLQPLAEKIDNINDKLDKVEDGTLSTLRNDILTGYYRCVEKGYRNDYDYQNLHHMYESYSDLHGNSYVADIMDRFDDLPVKEDTVAIKVVERKINK